MNQRRYTHSLPMPTLTGGSDEPQPACLGKSWAYDVLIEETRGWEARAALSEARSICKTCPIKLKCLADTNRNESWAKAIRGVDDRTEPTIRPQCGTTAGYTAHGNAREHKCDPCRIVYNAHKKAKKNEPVVCGTDSGYFRHKRTLKEDPCEPCKAAHALAERLRVGRRKKTMEARSVA